ncbi:uncharacterized protein LOC105838603 isoform X1 [Monomorium pharaonis]|uniref:uncharacterized protein LOC105838603 isoform X1 n=1 Tax=Monomorium pharaonis TaxID=307658 RepID=UPI00174668F6|nr:uncharacterized protein LOC105838603 isoform X1 [Monomorium pharaonis]
MAASRVDSEVGEYQLTSATAAVLSNSPDEARAIVKSWTDYNHRVKYIEESLSQSKFHDHPAKHSNNGNGVPGNHYVRNNEERPEQEEESISENEIHIANRLDVNEDNDRKLIMCQENNERFSDSKDKLEVTCTNSLNNEIQETQEIFDKRNQMSETVFEDESNEQQTHAAREIKIVTAPTNNCINNPSESAYRFQGVDKTIGSNKCERTGDIENRKNDCDEDGMEISSPRSRAYPHGNNVIVSAATSSTGAFREALRGGEASRRVVHSLARKDSRAPGKTRRSAIAGNPIGDREESRDQEIYLEDTRSSSARKCENCGEPHYPHSRFSRLQGKYSDYLNRETANRDQAAKFAVDQATDVARLTAPIAATAALRRSRSLPRLSIHDSGVACSGDHAPAAPDQMHAAPRQLVADLRQLLTLRQHYYPESGWGWVVILVGLLVQILSHGTHGAVGVFLQQVEIRFGPHVHLQAGWLGAMSTGVALLVSPITIAFCRKKSTRVTAVLGGLVTALGCLFTSFATQFHQLFFSYGTVVGIGVGMTRDCSTLMVAQYFKRKRELVEIFIVSGSGLGIAVMSAFIKGAITKIGWRLGLQAVTGVVFLTFILGTFYRSASLYHPQRRAILHLKNQKRKIKDKNKADKPPFFDFSTLKSKTVRILLISTGISAFGINTPIFYLAHQAEEEGLGDTVILLQTYLGLAWTLGCVAFGLLVVHRSVECRIARQYLTQAAVFVCGLCILALTAVQGNYHGYVMFAWIYGIFCGGYHYSLKMYTYERVRARNFAKTWGFVQCSQAIPIAIGVPISGYINVGCGGKAGYYFSSTCVLVGSFTLFFIDLHRRNLSRHKHTKTNGTKHTCSSDNCPQRRRMSFSQEPKNEGAHMAAAGAAGTTAAALVLGADIAPAQGEGIDVLGTDKPELTCISEEGIADMDLPDNLLEEFDYIGDCITSCNKVENYLMLSEFENNLIAEMPIIMDRRGRRWSVGRSKTSQSNCGQTSGVQSTTSEEEVKSKWRFTNVPPNANRMITVIDEASA